MVEAWANTSRAHSAAFAHCPEHAEEDRLEALRTLEQVKALAPGSWLALEAEGKFLTQVERDYEAALPLLRQAAELVERWEIYFSLGRIYRRMGEWDRALEASKKAAELFPQNVEVVIRVAAIHHWMRHYPEALELYDRSIELGPEWNNTYMRKAWVYWLWQADLPSARAALETLPPEEPSPNIQWGWFWQRFWLYCNGYFNNRCWFRNDGLWDFGFRLNKNLYFGCGNGNNFFEGLRRWWKLWNRLLIIYG